MTARRVLGASVLLAVLLGVLAVRCWPTPAPPPVVAPATVIIVPEVPTPTAMAVPTREPLVEQTATTREPILERTAVPTGTSLPAVTATPTPTETPRPFTPTAAVQRG